MSDTPPISNAGWINVKSYVFFAYGNLRNKLRNANYLTKTKEINEQYNFDI